MSIQNSYDDIKGALQNLYFDYVQQEEQNKQESFSNIEHFMIPPLPTEADERFKSDNDIPEEIKKGIIPSEVALVLEKFDLDPTLLNDNEKTLRKKYLEIIIKQLDELYIKHRDKFINNSPFVAKSSPVEKMVVSANMDSLKSLTQRILKLLIKELEPPTECPTCIIPKCPDCPTCPTCITTKCPDCPTCPTCPTITCPPQIICEDIPSNAPYIISIVILIIIVMALSYFLYFKN